MPQSKLDADVNRPGEFAVPPERGNQGFKVKANQDKYDVWTKDISPNLPESFVDPEDGQTKAIHWIANYGLKLKGKTARARFENTVDEYTLEFDEIEGSKYVYFDGASVQVFKNPRHENGKVIAMLNLGDPNIGYGP
jgi:hypothetical protein